ncbi:MAG: hypothetical protein GY771_01685, partial [bacterium]|nr:hypothetical protein [bacterium]
MSILARTANFFQLYRHICGESEVPDIYHFWGGVSLIAAAVEDRVWFQKFKHSQLYPNLFILLVGPSGLGKGTAIETLTRLADSGVTINKYRGRITGPHLIDHLGKPYIDEWGRKCISNPKLWLIMDELQNDISGNRKMIEDFIYLMTELYTASSYKVQTGTRTHGQVTIDKPLINWLAGTTEDDLREILTPRLLRSGFSARTCFVFGEYDFDLRMPRIKYPGDYEEIFKHLCYRLWVLQQTQGAFMITETADAELDKWYVKRPNPEEELLYSSWKRQHDLLLKFAMILCLADGGPMVIQHRHVMQSKNMIIRVYEAAEKLIATASETIETKPSNEVARYIKKRRQVLHTPASRYFRSMRGMNRKK